MSIRNLAIITGVVIATAFGSAVTTKAQDVFQPGRYRVMRGRSYYETDNRGAELLREAVRRGYREGYQAGRADRSARHRLNWRTNRVYRSANLGWENYVDRRQYQYYFQQGFQRGYQDGFYSRRRYGNGTDVLGNVLNTIFRAIRHS